MKKFFFLFLFMSLGFTSYCQQPFEQYGYQPRVATLSHGKYNEFFDQDSLVEIGSIILNTNSGKVVYFLTYDTVYSESDLKPEIISRWLSPDPLADQRYDYSPYNFVRNNPILFNDPTGALDDYYDTKGQYLGNDGQGDKMRLVKEGQEQTVTSKLNGANTSDADRNAARSSDNSAVITVDASVQSMLQQTGDNSLTSGNENSMLLVLNIYDADNPTLSAVKGPTGNNGETTIDYVPDGGQNYDKNTGFLIVGQAHGHPTTTKPGAHNDPGVSSDKDIPTSRNMGIPVYAIDSWNGSVGSSMDIHRANPNGSTKSTNYVGQTGSFNIGKDAMEIHGKKRNN